MEIELAIRKVILEKSVQEYIEKGYKVVKKESTRAYLTKPVSKNNMSKGLLKYIFRDFEKVYLHVDANGELGCSIVC